MSIMHKFYCTNCEQYVFADNLTKLCERLNTHNASKHPYTFANWNEGTVVQSQNYLAADAPPAYLAKHARYDATDWGDASRTPVLSYADREMLKAMGIQWD